MAFEGDLSNLALGDVLQTIAMSRQVGTFVIKGPDERRLACGPQGVALLSTRTTLGMRIGKVLTGMGKITSEQLEQALRLQRRRRSSRLGELLIEAGACTADDLRFVRRYLAAEEIFDVFTWKEGKFEFIAGEPEDPGLFADIWFDVGSLAMEAARRLDELPRAMAVAPLHEVFVRAEGENPHLSELEANPDLRRLHDLLDGTRTVHHVLEEYHRGRFDAWKGLETLLGRGLIRPAAPEEVVAAGRQAGAERDYLRAARLLARACDHYPEDDAIRRSVADAYKNAGEKRLAGDQLTLAGRSLFDQGKGLPAIEAFRAAVKLDPISAEAHEGLMQVLAQSGLVDEALAAARTAATLRLSSRDWDAAARAAEGGLALHPGDPQLLTTLANAHAGAGRTGEAVQLLDDVVQILESSHEDDRLLLDVHRRIVQLDSDRRDCQRRIHELQAAEAVRRKAFVRRVALAAGALVLATAAVPFLRGPSPAKRLDRIEVLLDEQKVEEARTALEELQSLDLDEDDRFRTESLMRRILGGGPVHPEPGLRQEVESGVDAKYRESATALQQDRIGDGLAALLAALELLDGPRAHKLYAAEPSAKPEFELQAQREIQIAIANSAAAGQHVSAKVAAVRDRFIEDVWRREDVDVLHQLVDLSAKVIEETRVEDFRAVPDLLTKILGHVKVNTDGLDKKTLEEVQTVLESHPQVVISHDRALARLRRKELRLNFTGAYSSAAQLERQGKLEEALQIYDEFLHACDDLRSAQPDSLYASIREEMFEDLKLDRQIETRRSRLREVLNRQDAAQKAESNDDVEEAFRIRRALVRDYQDVDFAKRFQMPLRLETAPPGAEVVWLDGTAGGRALGRTPLVTQHAISGTFKYVLRMPGYREQQIVRKGALDDGSGVVRIELPKVASWTSPGSGMVESAPAETGGMLFVAGRNGVVRRIELKSGAESGRFAPEGILDGFSAAPAILGRRIFVFSLDGKAFVLDRETLTKLDEIACAPVRASPVAFPCGVFVVDQTGRMRLVGEDGHDVWSKQIAPVRRDVARAGDHVLLVTETQLVMLVDAATGDVVAQRRLAGESPYGSPTVCGGRAYLAAESGLVACIDVSDLHEVWRNDLDGPVYGTIGADEKRVIACTASGAVHVMEAATGSVVAKALVGGKVDGGAADLPDGGFVVVTRKGNATRFDAAGRVVWKYDAGEDVCAPPRFAAGFVFLVTRKGVVLALAP